MRIRRRGPKPAFPVVLSDRREGRVCNGPAWVIWITLLRGSGVEVIPFPRLVFMVAS